MTGCVALSKLLNFAEPQFMTVKWANDTNFFFLQGHQEDHSMHLLRVLLCVWYCSRRRATEVHKIGTVLALLQLADQRER